MNTVLYQVVDVFTDRIFGGNPLAVVFGGEDMAAATMQKIASEFNLSETVFVMPPSRRSSTRRVRIFTPRAELPFAGHPTVGTAFVLAVRGECNLAAANPRIVLEEAIGDVEVSVQVKAGRVHATHMSVPKMPEAGPAPAPAAQLAQMIGVEVSDLHAEFVPQNWTCGVPFLFIALNSLDATRRARLHLDVWEKLLKHAWAASVYVFCLETEAPEAQIHARMFAPGFGIAEDPATGSAASALAGLLAKTRPDGHHAWVIEQGIEMGRASRIALECDKRNGAIGAVRVGGPSVPVAEGALQV